MTSTAFHVQLGLFAGCAEVADMHTVSAHTRLMSDAKRESLRSLPPTLHRSRVLRWPVDADGRVPRGVHRADGYLDALGIAPRGFGTVETFDFYDFETGRWTEANES